MSCNETVKKLLQFLQWRNFKDFMPDWLLYGVIFISLRAAEMPGCTKTFTVLDMTSLAVKNLRTNFNRGAKTKLFILRPGTRHGSYVIKVKTLNNPILAAEQASFLRFPLRSPRDGLKNAKKKQNKTKQKQKQTNKQTNKPMQKQQKTNKQTNKQTATIPVTSVTKQGPLEPGSFLASFYL